LHIPSKNIIAAAEGGTITDLGAMELARYTSTVEMDGGSPFKTSVNFYQTAQCHIPQDNIL
jgi:hypothetical protein